MDDYVVTYTHTNLFGWTMWVYPHVLYLKN